MSSIPRKTRQPSQTSHIFTKKIQSSHQTYPQFCQENVPKIIPKICDPISVSYSQFKKWPCLKNSQIHTQIASSTKCPPKTSQHSSIPPHLPKSAPQFPFQGQGSEQHTAVHLGAIDLLQFGIEVREEVAST